MSTFAGRVQALFRYPVKSMAGVALEQAAIGWYGIDGDRRFAFRRVGESGGMPWLTASRMPRLVLYRPAGGDDGAAATRVATPDGRELALFGDELRREIAAGAGGDVEPLRLDHGIFDEAPISLITTATIATMEREAGRGLDVRRFRPNVLVDTGDAAGLVEDAWVGKVVRLGDGPDAPAIAITQRDRRCVMLNIDPDTSVGDAGVMKAAVRLNGNDLGVYGVVVRTGTLAAGAKVYVDELAVAGSAAT